MRHPSGLKSDSSIPSSHSFHVVDVRNAGLEKKEEKRNEAATVSRLVSVLHQIPLFDTLCLPIHSLTILSQTVVAEFRGGERPLLMK